MATVYMNLLLCCLFVFVSWGATFGTHTNKHRPNARSVIPCNDHAAPAKPISYGVVCDAGSSSTKLKVYRVTRTDESLQVPQIDLIYTKKFEPSIDTYVTDQTGLQNYVRRILDDAKMIVPASQLTETNFYLLATAGLRFLTAFDSAHLIDAVTEVFDSLHLNHFHGHEGIGILSGEEEGVFAWIAANYLLGNFANNRPNNETVGVLEMGGGSTQITFIPNNPIYDGEFQITIGGRSYDLYVHSYLQYGMNAVNEWVASVLSDRYPLSQTLENPCMLIGDTKEIQVQNGIMRVMHGTSDPESCKQILQQILWPETGIRCEPKPCAVGNVYQPAVDNLKFYATQGFTYSAIALNAIGPDQVVDLDLLEQRAFQYCQGSLADARNAGVSESVASSNCLMGLYTPTLFTFSYFFPRDTTNIKMTSTIGTNTIEWSLGIMVMDTFQATITRRKR